MTTGRKLALGAVIVASVTAYLAFAGASSSWQYYLTVDECLDQAPRLVESRLRISGRIATDSLHIDQQRQTADFLLQGQGGTLRVICAGPLPDNLAEEMDVVVEGQMDRQKLVHGHKVLTKCASKYASQGRS